MTTAAALTAPTLDEIRTTAPQVPTTLEQTGLTTDMIEQLLVKTLYGGELTGLMLAERLRLPFTIIEPIIERIRIERLIEVRGGTSTASYRYTPTDLGRERAQQYLAINQYTGAAPVPLATYVAQMRALAASRGYIDRERLRKGFAHLIVPDAVLEQLGPAANANKAIFLYGPPGNGKTVLAEGLSRTLGGDMYMPYAIEIEGHIITMYDPISHEALDADVTDATSIIAAAPRDRRWVRIRRPVVIVGGELTLDMLDLTFNPLAKFYDAPLQLKANGGIFLVDDFGRQRMRPEDLLNRWIVPLESRVDYLTLHTGKKFQVPFDVLTVFDEPRPRLAGGRSVPSPYSLQDRDSGSVDRRLHAYPRAQLPASRSALPSRDGGVPATTALHADQPTAARMSSPRPARSGHGALPLPWYRAGAQPRDARRGVRGLLPRRQSVRAGTRQSSYTTKAGSAGRGEVMTAPRMALVNQRTDESLADRIEVAVTRNDRRKGLLGRDVFETSSALIIAPCFSIHTMFMRFDIDAVFVDDDGRAVKVVQGMGPWRIAVQPFAHAVVELPAGSLRERPVDVGDRLYLVNSSGERVGLSVSDLRGRVC